MNIAMQYRTIAAAALLTAGAIALVANVLPGQTVLVSCRADGIQGDNFSSYPSISADGNHVAFYSAATNLIPGIDYGGFVKDLETGQVSYVGNGSPDSISADGRFVTLFTWMNLLPEDTGWNADVYVKDMVTGKLRLASIAEDGTQSNGFSGTSGISGDGRYVAFDSDASTLLPHEYTGWCDVFVKDLMTGRLRMASVASDGTTHGNDYSFDPQISADGRYVVFSSDATNLAPGDTNNDQDVFVKDMVTGELRIASAADDGTVGNKGSALNEASISADGRFVSFQSLSTNLVPGDTNGVEDVFVKDMLTGKIVMASVNAKGQQGDGGSLEPFLSGDGRAVVFWGAATNLVPKDTNNVYDVFVKNLVTGAIRRASVGPNGAQPNNASGDCNLNGGGSVAVFDSGASNLVLDDTNETTDVFVHGTGIALVGQTRTTVGGKVAYIGKRVAFTATLRDKGTLQPVEGARISFKLGGEWFVDPAMTDANGRVQVSWIPPEEWTHGAQTLEAAYYGGANRQMSKGTATVDVRPGPVRLKVSNKSGSPGKWVLLGSKLTDWSYRPLVGRTLVYAVNGVAIGTAVTDEKGVAVQGYRIPVGTSPGSYSVAVTFAGDACHTAHTTTGILTVQ